jgi:hypothetical protein
MNQRERERCMQKVKMTLCRTLIVLAIALVLGFGVVALKKDDSISANPPAEDSENVVVTQTPREVLFQSKLEHLLSDKSEFSDPLTPQYAALAWLANEDPAAVDEADQGRLEIRFVLATLYFSTEGSMWNDDLQFLSGLYECNWTSPSTGQGVSCDENGQVTSISICKNFACCILCYCTIMY